MKKIKIMLVLLVTIMSLLAFTSCNKKDIVFMLEESNVELTVGATYTPKLIIENVENDELDYSYDQDIVKIENGLIYCLTKGDCEVIITLKNEKDIGLYSRSHYGCIDACCYCIC